MIGPFSTLYHCHYFDQVNAQLAIVSLIWMVGSGKARGQWVKAGAILRRVKEDKLRCPWGSKLEVELQRVKRTRGPPICKGVSVRSANSKSAFLGPRTYNLFHLDP